MKTRLLPLALLALAACATPDPTTAPAPEPAVLSDAEFQALWEAAYKSDPESDSEAAFTEMLARDDLSPAQRGDVFYGRGTMRSIYVRDWPEAFPQCALGDFMQAKDYPVSDARLEQIKSGMRYQLSRLQYFSDAPRLCKEYAAEASVWLYAWDGAEN